ncbi:MAG: hypothetical protein U0L97_03730, partial [Candidatus Saccharimonadaceae bacterium]|nr:hypothetical protein [Candidatus Saccharimonadaceae bacterium]
GEVINDGGTHDYDELDNQPQINGHTLEGNKTNEQLGIPVYSAGENITISDDYVISATGGGGGSAVNSVNGQTGDVTLTTSDLENTSDYQTGAQVQNAIAGKQDEITSSNKLLSDLVDDTNQTNKFVTTSEKQTWNNKYDKPNSGIPKTDLASAVQTSLNKADTAIQAHQDISGKLDTSKVKSAYSTTSGDVYDVTYINSTVGDIESLLSEV